MESESPSLLTIENGNWGATSHRAIRRVLTSAAEVPTLPPTRCASRTGIPAPAIYRTGWRTTSRSWKRIRTCENTTA